MLFTVCRFSSSINTASSKQNYGSAPGSINSNSVGSNDAKMPGLHDNSGESLENNEESKTASSPIVVTDDYLDNYEDYTPQLNNDFEFVVKTMPGIEWLGAGFDILKYDPLNPNEAKNKKSFQAIILTNSSNRAQSSLTARRIFILMINLFVQLNSLHLPRSQNLM